jgi:ABC-type antimicrobial peptide transport system permease subunit
LPGSAGLDLTGTGQLYLVQGVPAAHAVIPTPLILAAIGIVILICVLTLAIIVRLATRPALSEALRLNED